MQSGCTALQALNVEQASQDLSAQSGLGCMGGAGGIQRADARLPGWKGEVDGGGDPGLDPVATARLDLAGL